MKMEKPEMELIKFEQEDVIVTSTICNPIGTEICQPVNPSGF